MRFPYGFLLLRRVCVHSNSAGFANNFDAIANTAEVQFLYGSCCCAVLDDNGKHGRGAVSLRFLAAAQCLTILNNYCKHGRGAVSFGLLLLRSVY